MVTVALRVGCVSLVPFLVAGCNQNSSAERELSEIGYGLFASEVCSGQASTSIIQQRKTVGSASKISAEKTAAAMQSGLERAKAEFEKLGSGRFCAEFAKSSNPIARLAEAAE
ncbi:hypothetical protein ACFQ14_13800 [Pseudahrensia aquimaris]|uniref:Lipoprotein n=1 Tax=Pseudahrensia aquimaris TaxID=744461 RepID=A0ABW3FHQ6_9HYPH